MKYGNFVGGGWLTISKDEQNEMKDYFKSQLEMEFGKDFFKGFSVSDNSGGPVKEIIVVAHLAKPFNGRNRYKELCENVSEIRFFVTKDKGKYLEIKDESHPYEPQYWKHDTENCPPFSYGCTMYVNGRERPYRARHWESIQHWSPYTYGTEIKDLKYESPDMCALRKSITAY